MGSDGSAVVASISLRLPSGNGAPANGVLYLGPLYAVQAVQAGSVVAETEWGGAAGLVLDFNGAETVGGTVEVYLVDTLNGRVVGEWTVPASQAQDIVLLGIDGMPTVYASFDPQSYGHPTIDLYEPLAGDYAVIIRGVKVDTGAG